MYKSCGLVKELKCRLEFLAQATQHNEKMKICWKRVDFKDEASGMTMQSAHHTCI